MSVHPVTQQAAALSVIAVVECCKAAEFDMEGVIAVIRSVWSRDGSEQVGGNAVSEARSEPAQR